MSIKDRHILCQARGWTYSGRMSHPDIEIVEVWLKPDGCVHFWLSRSDVDMSPPCGFFDELEPWIERHSGGANLRTIRLAAVDRYVVGATFPKIEASVSDILRFTLSWDAPFFVAALDEWNTVLEAALLVENKVIPWLESRKGQKIIVGGPQGKGWKVRQYLASIAPSEARSGTYYPSSYPRGLSAYNTKQFIRGRAQLDPRVVLPMKYYQTICRAAVRRAALAKDFDACYDRVRNIVAAAQHPERMHVIAETPDFVIFGEPGINAKLERDFGV